MNGHTIRAAIHVSAIFALYLSIAMLIPAAVDLYHGNSDWQVFALSAFFQGGLAMAVALATRGRPPPATPRFGFLVLNLLWLTLAVGGALPLAASSINMTFAGALFESVSGITTTGGTVISGLDVAPPGILLWRSILNFIGGLGVIAIGLFLLPFLNIGGITYFRLESSDINARPFERLQTFTINLIIIYTLLVALCTLLYAAGGMTGFDAINHAMATLATGGFSTHDTSFAQYANSQVILWTGTFFMFLGGLPFSIMMLILIRGRFESLADPQIKVYAAYCAAFSFAATVYLIVADNMPPAYAFANATFNFVSIITTTGFASEDYTQWGPFIVAAIFVATFLGGCSGSTAGAIKSYRLLVLFEMLGNGVRRLVYPNTIYSVRYGDRTIGDDMQRAVVLFVSSFFVIWACGTVLMAATGLDFLTSLSGSLACLTNVGPGLGDVIGPAGNYSKLNDPALLILSLLMLMGRLELLAVLVVFSPTFWRR